MGWLRDYYLRDYYLRDYYWMRECLREYYYYDLDDNTVLLPKPEKTLSARRPQSFIKPIPFLWFQKKHPLNRLSAR